MVYNQIKMSMIGFCHVCQDRYRVQRHERQSLDPSAETLHVAESVHWFNKQNRLFQNKVNIQIRQQSTEKQKTIIQMKKQVRFNKPKSKDSKHIV